MNIYVGNVPYAATDEDLETLFGEYGPVASATIIRDRQNNNRSKGFGFVEMENQEDGKRAIEALDGKEMMGRPLKVNPARPHKASNQKQLPDTPKPDSSESQSSPDDTFHNPYTFVPSPPRDKIKAGKFAGDFDPLKHDPPLDHASLNKDLWTGHIPIKITTVTPLVLLKDDGRKRDTTKHQTYDVHDHIPEPSLRGMLRSAYEVVTNSRYACFGREHKKRLAYRMDPGEAAILIPAIIKNGDQQGKLVAQLCPGTSIPTPKGPKQRGTYQDGAMYAAMFDPYNNTELYTEYDEKYTPKTGHEVWAQIVLCEHRRGNRVNYRYWKALKIWRTDQYPNRPTEAELVEIPPSSLYTDINEPIERIVKGHIFITNKNMKGKHDERIFFYDNSNMPQIKKEITDDRMEVWENLIKNYRDAHTDIFDRPGAQNKPWKKIGNDPGKTAWSPHLYQDSKHRGVWRNDPHGRITDHDAIDLKDGDMVYARCEFNGNTISGIKDLFPVTISRELYENSPEDLLDESLRSAKTLCELSPADRLFGWTPQGQGSDGGYKSRIRVVCEDSGCTTTLKNFKDDPLPLTILGQPKPEQGRFYVAADDKGTPQSKVEKKKDAGYDKNGKKQLRGRKHYWHHKGLEVDKDKAEDYWDPSDPSKDQNREYIRTGRKRDTQNRSIKGWIEPGNEFEATLYVQNLQPEEVGALLWLLTLNDNLGEGDDKRYFKLGYGKPLGFGSVEIEIDADRLKNGCLPLGTDEDWKTYYEKFNDCPPATMDKVKQDDCLKKFIDSMLDAYKHLNQRVFEELPFIKGFLRVLQGPNKDIPIHYPRTNPRRHPDGKNFEWFMDNERGRSYQVARRAEVGKQLALPDVTEDEGLPYNPSKPRN